MVDAEQRVKRVLDALVAEFGHGGPHAGKAPVSKETSQAVVRAMATVVTAHLERTQRRFLRDIVREDITQARFNDAMVILEWGFALGHRTGQAELLEAACGAGADDSEEGGRGR